MEVRFYLPEPKLAGRFRVNAEKCVMTFCHAVCAVTLPVLLIPAAVFQDKNGAVTLQIVKYDSLKEAVLKQRGKVVVVDLWGFF